MIVVANLWDDDVVNAGKLPLLLCLFAFVVTFVVTRIIVRLIRSGRGPFKDNSVGGVHVHHVVPGIALMVLGGLVAIGSLSDGWTATGGVLFGMGLALVLDEFALVLHLEDVYWEQQGRLSVDIVFIVCAVMALVILVGSPFGLETARENEFGRVVFVILVVTQLLMVVISAMKGKVMVAIIGVFIPVVALIGAIRLARPHSPWARKRYAERSDKLERSTNRDAHIERKYRSKIYWLQDAVAGIGATDPDRQH